MSGNKIFDGSNLGDSGAYWSVPLTGPNPAQLFYVGVQCDNIPTDGQLGFTVTCDDSSVQPIFYPMGPIINPMLIVQMPVPDWAAGGTGEVAVSYRPGPTPPPADSGIQVIAMIPVVGAVG